MDNSYLGQGVPRDINNYFRCMGAILCIEIIICLIFISSGETHAIGDLLGIMIYSVLFVWLYSELEKKNNAARIVLIVITCPFSLFFLLSRDVRTYCKND